MVQRRHTSHQFHPDIQAFLDILAEIIVAEILESENPNGINIVQSSGKSETPISPDQDLKSY
jgi:hypothetical protein